MKNNIERIALGLALTISAFAQSAAPDYAVCRAVVPNGTDLVFTIIDGAHGPGTFRSLFQGGDSHGTVTVRPVTPLKIQFATQFPVSSSWSKRFAIQINAGVQIEGVHFLLQSEGKFDRLSRFPATISYGNPRIRFEAQCQLHPSENS